MRGWIDGVMKTEALGDERSNGILTERYREKILGVISCFDRVVITGTLTDCCHAGAMMGQMLKRKIRFFDYPQFANGLRERLRVHAEEVAHKAGLEIEFLAKKIRKEDRVAEVIKGRGDHPGLVHIFSAMEPCGSFRPWHDKGGGKTMLKPTAGKCLHYYFYFMDEELGLCYMRAPTWAPFRLQFYCNGHNRLARLLRKEDIGFKQVDNAFVLLDDVQQAQQLSDTWEMGSLHRKLDGWARQYCPVVQEFSSGYHWSLMQVESATDILFARPEDLAPLYEGMVRTAVHVVKAEDVATFLGRKLSPLYQGEAGNRFNTRIEGTRIRHYLGPASIKMDDKLGRVLRIETVVNNIGFFKHHRKVKHRDGTLEMKQASVQKTIYSLGVMRELLMAANRRYLRFVSELEDHTQGRINLDRITRSVRDESQRPHRGFNLFEKNDLTFLLALLRGEHQISGLTNRLIHRHLTHWNSNRIGRLLRRCRLHGLIRKIGKTYKYYLTPIGQKLLIAALKLKEYIILPSLAHSPA